VIQYSKKLVEVGIVLRENQLVCNKIVQNAIEFYEIGQAELDEHIRSREAAGHRADRVSVGQALKHYIRDWATSGVNEREAAFPCILDSLRGLFPNLGYGSARVVLPGAGLGRLGHEVAKLGTFQDNAYFESYPSRSTYPLTNHL
jgi:hypothetical protein